MGSDGAGWARMVPGPPSPEPRSPPPPDRKRRNTAGAAGNQGPTGIPRPVVPPGISLLPSRTVAVPPAAARSGCRFCSVRDLRPPPLPPWEGPAAAGPATPSDAADPVPRRLGSPTNTVPSNTVPPLTCPRPWPLPAGATEPRAEAALRGALPGRRESLRASAPSESGRGFSARCTALGQYSQAQAMYLRAGSFNAVHLYLREAPGARTALFALRQLAALAVPHR